MKGIVDFRFKNIKEGNQIESSEITLDNGKTWMTISEFVSKLDEWETPLMFVRQLNYTFAIIEKELLKQGYICKYCVDRGKGFHPYSSKLKEKTYAPIIFGKRRKCYYVRFSKFKMYDAEKWLGNGVYRNPFSLLTSNEYAGLLKYSERKYLMSTPAKEAWRDFTLLPLSSEVDEQIYKDIEKGIQGGIISGEYSFHIIGWHYDITSMYPYILSTIDYFPNLLKAEYLTVPEMPDHDHYAYWIAPGMHCNTMTQEIIPVGSIKAPLTKVNCYKARALELYLDKRDAIKGTLQYDISKLKVNSFIGKIIQRTNLSESFYPYMGSDEGRVKGHYDVNKRERQVGEYTYLIAKARQYILEIMQAAREIVPDIKFFQINTDGFFTDKPIPYDEEKWLGSLRQEYIGHNIHVFACNQYACDEEVCIAGLPKSLYVPGQIEYKFLTFSWSKEKNCYIYKCKKLTLGEKNELQEEN